MINRIGIAALWLLGLACVFAAINKNDPYLISLRGAGNIALAVASVVISAVLIRRGYWRRRGIAGKLLVLLWGLAPISMLGAHLTFEVRKRNVLHTNAAQARRLGRHFVVGYSSFEEVAALAERGLIAGVYITRHNLSGRSDTHHFNADLDTPLEVLEASDWRPFRDVLSGSTAQLMIGHVTLTAADPDRPASHSKRVVDGIIRRRWHYQGVIITDDLVMGAIYQHDVCTAVVEALNAGVDLLLVAYDGAQFYRIFACASAGFEQGKLDPAMLGDSAARLSRALPLD
jgi:hypothetical protein